MRVIKTYIHFSIGIVMVIFAGFFALAYNSGGPPSTIGHSAEELDLSAGVNGNAVFNGNVGIGAASPNPSYKLDVRTGTSGSIITSGQIYANTNNQFASIYANQAGTGPAALFMGGNVGIGTTSPGTDKLKVVGNIKATGDICTDVGGGRCLSSGGGGGVWLSGATAGVIYYNGGQVGIGTANPGAKFHVYGANFDGGAAVFESDHGNSVTIKGREFGYNLNDVAFLNFQDSAEPSRTRNAYIGLTGAGATGGTGHLRFATQSNVERMRITNNGNVGIGTVFPSSKLEVLGNIETQGLYKNDGSKFINSCSPGNAIREIDGVGSVTCEPIVRRQSVTINSLCTGAEYGTIATCQDAALELMDLCACTNIGAVSQFKWNSLTS